MSDLIVVSFNGEDTADQVLTRRTEQHSTSD